MNIINLRTAPKGNNRWLSFPRTLTRQQTFINWESKDNKFTERKSLQKKFIGMKFYQILHWISRNIIDHFGMFRQLIKTNIPPGAHSIICINTSVDEYTPRWNTMSCVCYARVRSWIWKSSYKQQQQQQQQQHRVETTKIIRIFRIAKFNAKHQKKFQVRIGWFEGHVCPRIIFENKMRTSR